jgi:hypothetical protein
MLLFLSSFKMLSIGVVTDSTKLSVLVSQSGSDEPVAEDGYRLISLLFLLPLGRATIQILSSSC